MSKTQKPWTVDGHIVHQEITFCSAKGPLVMSTALLASNPSILSKLSCRAGVAQDAQIVLVARLPRITLETQQPEQLEHPSTRAWAALGGGLCSGCSGFS